MNKEALKLALEALIDLGADDYEGFGDVLDALEEALTQPEQEPVAFINVEQRKLEWAKYMTWDTPTVVNLPKIPLYTTPPQPWEKFCDSNCVWTDHHPDCKLAEPAVTESHKQEPVTWRNAAIRVGEDLCSVGPFGYYDMTAEQWLDWALSVVTVHAPPPQRLPLTDEELYEIYNKANWDVRQSWDYERAIEAKLKEKNT